MSVDIVGPTVTDLAFHWPGQAEMEDDGLLPAPPRRTAEGRSGEESPVVRQRLGSIDAQLSELSERVEQALATLARLQESIAATEQRTEAIAALEAGAAEADALHAEVKTLRTEFRESERRQLAVLEDVVQVLADSQNVQRARASAAALLAAQ